MNTETLQSVIAKYYTQKMIFEEKTGTSGVSVDDITFYLLRSLFDLDKNGHLSPESRIFLRCENAISHISHIVRRIFLDHHDDQIVIQDEIDKILAGNTIAHLLHMEERIKQQIYTRVNSIHAQLNEQDVKINQGVENTTEIMEYLDKDFTRTERIGQVLAEILQNTQMRSPRKSSESGRYRDRSIAN